MASYAYIGYQSGFLTFENKLSTYFNPNDGVIDTLEFRLDIKKNEVNKSLDFGVLGLYRADQIVNGNQDKIYELIAGRVFEIMMYDCLNNDGNKIFEDAFLVVYENLRKVTEDNLKFASQKLTFPVSNLVGFHQNLNKYLALIC